MPSQGMRRENRRSYRRASMSIMLASDVEALIALSAAVMTPERGLESSASITTNARTPLRDEEVATAAAAI